MTYILRLTATIFFLFFLSLHGISQSSNVVIGSNTFPNGAVNELNPIGDAYHSARCQYLYTGALINSYGLPSGKYISRIGFSVNATTLANHYIEDYTIKLGNVPYTLSGPLGSYTTWFTQPYTVYGPTDYSYQNGFAGTVLFNLDYPFYYNGGGIVLEICYGNNNSITTGNPIVNYFYYTDNYESQFSHVHTISVSTGTACGLNEIQGSNSGGGMPKLLFTYSSPCTGAPTSGDAITTINQVCPGESVSLSLSTTQTSGGIIYQWFETLPNGNSTAINGAIYNTLTTPVWSDRAYYCQLTCLATGTSSNSTPVSIFVNDIEDLSTQPSNQSVCTNNIADAIAVNTSADSNFLSYQWYSIYTNTFGVLDTTILNSQTTNTYLPNSQNGNFFCRVYNSLTGCSQNTPVANVTAFAPQSTFPPSDAIICRGDSVQFNATGTNVVSFAWSNGVENNSYSSTLESGDYSVVGTDINGCHSEASFHVTVNELPIVLAGADIEICPNVPVTLAATGALNYTWNNGISQATSFLPQIGNYIVIGVDGNGCSNSDTLHISILSELNPVVTESITGTTYGNDGSIEIDYSATNPPCTFDWSFDGTGDFNDEQNLLNVPAGDYSLTILDSLGCTSHYNYNVPLNLNMFIPTAISPNNDGFNDTWQIRGLEQFEWYEISVFNSQGVLVFHKVNGYSPWNGYYNSEHLVADDYIYVIDTKNPGRRFTGYITITY